MPKSLVWPCLASPGFPRHPPCLLWPGPNRGQKNQEWETRSIYGIGFHKSLFEVPLACTPRLPKVEFANISKNHVANDDERVEASTMLLNGDPLQAREEQPV